MTLPLNTIICGDCLDVMKDWPDGCVDIAFCDPPYGMKYHSGRYKGGNPHLPIYGVKPNIFEKLKKKKISESFGLKVKSRKRKQ